MKIIGWIALTFMVLEVVQLYVAARFIGVEQIRRNLHPLDGPAPRSFWFSATWVAVLMADYAFQAALLVLPMIREMSDRPYYIRTAALVMIITSFVGFVWRRSCGVKWGIIVMTFEGALRAGFFLFVFMYVVVMHGVWWHLPYNP